MNPAKLMISGCILSTVLSTWPAVRFAAGADKHLARHRAGSVPERIGETGPADGSAQWSADPEKGWVRAEKQHHELGASVREPKHRPVSAKGKQKTN